MHTGKKLFVLLSLSFVTCLTHASSIIDQPLSAQVRAALGPANDQITQAQLQQIDALAPVLANPVFGQLDHVGLLVAAVDFDPLKTLYAGEGVNWGQPLEATLPLYFTPGFGTSGLYNVKVVSQIKNGPPRAVLELSTSSPNMFNGVTPGHPWIEIAYNVGAAHLQEAGDILAQAGLILTTTADFGQGAPTNLFIVANYQISPGLTVEIVGLP